MFLRLSGCNLHCSWCDTPYTWDWKGVNGLPYNIHEQTHLYIPDEARRLLEAKLDNNQANLLVVTGGEPLLQQKALVPLIATLFHNYLESELRVEFETNGTIDPVHFGPNAFFGSRERIQFNVSPKLQNSGNSIFKTDGEALKQLVGDRRARFKFVVEGVEDTAWNEIDNIRQIFGLNPSRIWIMPEATNAIQLGFKVQPIAEKALLLGYNFTSRMHVQIWGAQRGK